MSTLHHDPRAVLQAHGMWTKKHLGQNFLVDPTVPDQIVTAGGVRADDVVFEIGAGVGTLTRALIGRAAQITALEFDREIVPVLRAETLWSDAVTVRSGNVLDINWAEEAEAAGQPLMIYGNVPYNISSAIVAGLLEAPPNSWRRACLLLQREFAERVAATMGTRKAGTLSALASLWSHASIALHVPRTAFHPAPRVESAVLVLERRAEPAVEVGSPETYRKVVRALFAQRRKMARKALKPIAANTEALLAAAGVDGTRRGETFNLEELGRLAKALHDGAGR
jgi:16S rRNA (adenine1518-N6/adenine1519-N6)-dimethyltransferase